MAKKKEDWKDDSTIEVEHNGKKTDPMPMNDFSKVVDDSIRDHKKLLKRIKEKYSKGLIDWLEHKEHVFNFHLERILQNLVSNQGSKPGTMTIKVCPEMQANNIVIKVKVTSKIPNEAEQKFDLAKISLDTGQLELFD